MFDSDIMDQNILFSILFNKCLALFLSGYSVEFFDLILVQNTWITRIKNSQTLKLTSDTAEF